MMTQTEIPEATRLAMALVGLSHHVLHLFNDVGRGHDLTAQQTELICAVIVRGRTRMADLSKLLHLEKSNLSGLVDRAEQRGLIVRTRDPKDRRATWVELTAEGERLAMRTHGVVTERLNRLVDQLPAEDQRRLTAVVEQITTGE
ncbi:MarR family winged helix-turn-helix transcriptional regulator [Nonomuraea sp. M3C6]|uniref:MarR family winged helix-turn-helix transcriptional regulator n=1 Tax=Nonomuraea marmarensis TaxID=3351344 RepID=A0ABW7A6Z6_9ACTN